MAGQFFLERGEKTYGPYSAAHLKKLAAAGKLLPTDLVRREGMEKGVLVPTVKGLYPSAQTEACGADTIVPVTKVVPAQPAASLLTRAPDSVPASKPTPALSHAPGSEPELPDEMALVPIPDQDEWAPAVSPAPTPAPAPKSSKGPAVETKKEPVRTRRAVAVSGAVLMGQDGVSVHYRKKCVQCGKEDGIRSTMIIGIGITRATFFCPKCRKPREVQIRGIT